MTGGAEEKYRPTPENDAWEGLPESWGLMPLGRVARIAASSVDKKTDPDEEPVRLCNYTDVYYNEVITDDLDFMKASATRREIDAFRLRGGEVLLTKDSETAEDIAKPAYVRPGLDGVVCGYHLYLLRSQPGVMDGRFLMRACSVPPVSDQFVIGANGITRFGLGQQELASALIPVPPVPEQLTIADFLDRETARIDDLIAQKERLLELLEEQRAAMIDRSVMPQGENRDQWSTTKVRRILSRVRRRVRVDPDAPYREIGIRSWGKGIFHKDEIRGHQLGNKDIYAIRRDDFILNIVFAWEGAVAVAKASEDGMVASHRFPTFRHDPAVVKLDYLLMFFQSAHGRALMALNSPGAAGRNRTIRLGQLLEEEIPLPSLERQRETLLRVRNRIAEIKALQEAARGTIDLLAEYRTALISAAVTGKIDVREET